MGILDRKEIRDISVEELSLVGVDRYRLADKNRDISVEGYFRE